MIGKHILEEPRGSRGVHAKNTADGLNDSNDFSREVCGIVNVLNVRVPFPNLKGINQNGRYWCLTASEPAGPA